MLNCWFDYKTVVVTGASSGIGAGLVKRLINDHCCKIIGVARNRKKMETLVKELGSKAGNFTYRLFDVSVNSNWEQFAASLEEDGIYPDMVINNAGVLPKFDRFSNYGLEEIDAAMKTNFYSCVYSMHAMLPIVLESSSTPAIVNVASSAALCALAGTSVYSASKAATKSLTDAVREEYRGRLYVGLVCPGFTKTDIFHNQKQVSGASEKALDFVSTSCDKMVDNIIKGIWKKKSDMVFGIDAKLMDIGSKLLGVGVSQLSSIVLKKSGLKLFEDVFSSDKPAVTVENETKAS